MGKSIKRKPFHGMTKSSSEKQDKKMWHSKFRRKEKIRIGRNIKNNNEDNHITVDIREVSNPWCFAKDGKRRFSIYDYMKFLKERKDIDYPFLEYQKLFRK